MITLADYWMGRDVSHAGEWTHEIHANAYETVRRANELREEYARSTGDSSEWRVSSGWRPRAINAATPGAARFSRHLTGEAIDIADPSGVIDAWCVCASSMIALTRISLYLEHPSATPGWCHLQTVPPRSGKRMFFPFPTAARIREPR